jgi:hypothetical protein
MINRERSSKTLATPPFITGHNDNLGMNNNETAHKRFLINDLDDHNNKLSETTPAIKVSYHKLSSL